MVRSGRGRNHRGYSAAWTEKACTRHHSEMCGGIIHMLYRRAESSPSTRRSDSTFLRLWFRSSSGPAVRERRPARHGAVRGLSLESCWNPIRRRFPREGVLLYTWSLYVIMHLRTQNRRERSLIAGHRSLTCHLRAQIDQHLEQKDIPPSCSSECRPDSYLRERD